MLNFIIITVALLITSGFAIVLTDKAQQQRHDDSNGLAYTLGTVFACFAYTLGNLVLMITENSW